jgi:hypothetical protein
MFLKNFKTWLICSHFTTAFWFIKRQKIVHLTEVQEEEKQDANEQQVSVKRSLFHFYEKQKKKKDKTSLFFSETDKVKTSTTLLYNLMENFFPKTLWSKSHQTLQWMLWARPRPNLVVKKVFLKIFWKTAIELLEFMSMLGDWSLEHAL